MRVRLLLVVLFALAWGWVGQQAEAARYARASRHVRTYHYAPHDAARHGLYTGYRGRVAPFPKYRQIDGRTLWDLGKQNGQWPRFK